MSKLLHKLRPRRSRKRRNPHSLGGFQSNQLLFFLIIVFLITTRQNYINYQNDPILFNKSNKQALILVLSFLFFFAKR